MDISENCQNTCGKGAADPYEKKLAALAGTGQPAPRAETVALIIPPSPQIPTPGREFLIRGPFEGFTAIATVVKKLGYRLKVIDCRPEGASDTAHVMKELAGADIVGISTYCDSYTFLLNITAAIKAAAPGKLVFLGGPLVTSLPETILGNSSADLALMGEAELTLIEFLESVFDAKRRDLSGIAGLALRTGGGVKLTAPRAQIQNLDNLPFPDYTIWPNYDDIVKHGQIIISSTRGCPGNCSFCYKTIPALRCKSVERFEEEVAYLKKTTGFDYVWLNDLTFNADMPRAMKVAEILFKYGVKYHAFARVNGVTAEFARKLKETGCQGVWFGIESYDQKILNLARKGTTIEQINSALKITAAAGLATRGLFIVGLPGETEDSLKKMLEFIKTGDFIPLVKYLVPFPGTSLYADALKAGKIKDTPAFLRELSDRKVGDYDDRIINLTGLEEPVLRDYFHRIWELTREKEAA